MNDKNRDGKEDKEDQAEKNDSGKNQDKLIRDIMREIHNLPLEKQKIMRALIRLLRKMEE